jgi:hypothetical protein
MRMMNTYESQDYSRHMAGPAKIRLAVERTAFASPEEADG